MNQTQKKASNSHFCLGTFRTRNSHHTLPQCILGNMLIFCQGSALLSRFHFFLKYFAIWSYRPNITLLASLGCEIFEYCHCRSPISIHEAPSTFIYQNNHSLAHTKAIELFGCESPRIDSVLRENAHLSHHRAL